VNRSCGAATPKITQLGGIELKIIRIKASKGLRPLGLTFEAISKLIGQVSKKERRINGYTTGTSNAACKK
jgi:hypothetical protein